MTTNPIPMAPSFQPPMASQAPGIKMNGPPSLPHHAVHPHAGSRGISPQIPPQPHSHPASSHASPTLPSFPGPLGQQQPPPAPGVAHRSPSVASDRVTSDQGDGQPAPNLQGTSDYSQLAKHIKDANPQILRHVLRDHWQQCFIGSEFHTAFVLNTMIHQASPSVLSRAIQDFGSKMVKSSLPQVLGHCTAEEYDRVSDQILSTVSLEFLDRALARRLETIDARSLVNALARAERLGYDVSDIVEDRNNGKPEHVIPSLQGVTLPSNVPPPQRPWMTNSWPGSAPPPPSQAPISGSDTPGSSPSPVPGSGVIVHCERCQRPCSGHQALSYHRSKNSCRATFSMDDINRTICPHCGRYFTSGGGLYYHKKSAVCGAYSDRDFDMIKPYLAEYLRQRQGQNSPAIGSQWQQSPSTTASHGLTTPMKGAVNTPSSSNIKHSSPQVDMSPASLYAHLNPATRQRYEDEVAETERKYGKWMQEALDLPEPERGDRMNKLKNSYNTKQSTTRKRYGIRLRGNRTPEEIESERRRLLGSKYAPEIWGVQGNSTPAAAASSSQPTSIPEAGVPQPITPHKRVRLSEMGGLSGSAASVETTDPTAFLTSSQPSGLTRVREAHTHATTSGTTPDDPMSIDSDGDVDIKESSNDKPKGDDGTDSSGSDTDDIPAH